MNKRNILFHFKWLFKKRKFIKVGIDMGMGVPITTVMMYNKKYDSYKVLK